MVSADRERLLSLSMNGNLGVYDEGKNGCPFEGEERMGGRTPVRLADRFAITTLPVVVRRRLPAASRQACHFGGRLAEASIALGRGICSSRDCEEVMQDGRAGLRATGMCFVEGICVCVGRVWYERLLDGIKR
jgi:hypothetical protein